VTTAGYVHVLHARRQHMQSTNATDADVSTNPRASLSRALRGALLFLLVLVASVWSALSRPEAVLLAVPFLIALCSRPIGEKRPLIAVVCVVLIAWPLQPLSITFQNAPGPPRVLRNCDMVGLSGHAAAFEAQRRGQCIVASDISGIVDPEYYVVW